MTRILSVVLLLSFSTACIKTAEQVNREKRFEAMSENMKDSQGLLAEAVAQMKDMQTQLDKLNGRVEELEHRQKQIDPATINKMNENLTLLQTQQQNDSQQLTQIQNELKEQRGFIEKVTASLSSMNHEKPRASSKKKSAKTELINALELVKSGKYAEAKPQLEALIDAEGLSPGDNNKIMHGLGRIEYYTKNYDKALVYFSKVYTKFPKSSLAPSSLLYIAKSLKKMKKSVEAKEAFTRVAEDYPGSVEAAEAKKEI
ncbi:MAG: tetratricopeptide repeat protein [Bacteriovoracaceae bacterium]